MTSQRELATDSPTFLVLLGISREFPLAPARLDPTMGSRMYRYKGPILGRDVAARSVECVQPRKAHCLRYKHNVLFGGECELQVHVTPEIEIQNQNSSRWSMRWIAMHGSRLDRHHDKARRIDDEDQYAASSWRKATTWSRVFLFPSS